MHACVHGGRGIAHLKGRAAPVLLRATHRHNLGAAAPTPNACLLPVSQQLLTHGSAAALQVYGPEASMTGICQEAINYVKSFD